MSGNRRAGLSKNALPTIFEGAPSYLSKKMKTPRKQSRRHACRTVCSPCTGGTSSGTSIAFQTQQQAATAQNSDEVNKNSDVVAASDPGTSAFDEMFCAASTLCLRTPSWGVHRIDLEGYRDLVFHDASLLRTSDGACVLFNRKTVHVNSDMAVQVYIFGKPVDCSAVGVNNVAESTSQVEHLLKTVDSVRVCGGGPSLKDFSSVEPESAFVDCQSKWRHKRCQMLLPEGSICRACSSLFDTFRIHAERQAARVKQRQPLKRIRLSVSPTKKHKVDSLRHIRSLLQKAQAWLLKRNHLITKELKESRAEIIKLQEEDITKKLQSLDIPPMQLFLVQECISAAKCTTKNNRRYTDDWLLLCLLLNIRSPSTYAFLRSNNILPMPCTSTIRRYISMVGLKCGFDEHFFKALKI
ncbi:hypothetical protein HPB51_011769 [Rhipicephalus microplus]|uniref:Uncharacterized protein n=1 Tax=Rhipicephalus microplus TaxID=6941 RepID=A0A9J6E1E8_RHIMP|nr:hypothetical protein HPB51_011769 [Rhipicephalus microplus]